MPETPKKVIDLLDKTISGLNSRWDLQLSRLHGAAAVAAQNTAAPAKRCSARLRYLCGRLQPESLILVIEEFYDTARSLYAQWTFKPLQEPGTLPRFPVTKSHLAREVKRQRELGLNKLTNEQRQNLLHLLDKILKDEIELTKNPDYHGRSKPIAPSDIQQPPASTVPIRRTSPRHAQTLADASLQARDLHRHEDTFQSLESMQPPPKTRAKRASTESGSEKNKRARSDGNTNQTTLAGFVGRPATPLPKEKLQTQPSFDSSTSPTQSTIFDTPENQSNASSGNTSILEDAEEESQNYLPSTQATEFLELALREEQSRLLQSPSTSFSADEIGYKLHSTFTSSTARLPSGLPFDYLYELETLSTAWDLDSKQILKEVQKIHNYKIPSAEERWTVYKRIKPAAYDTMPAVFGQKGWQASDQHHSIYLTAALQWTAKTNDAKLLSIRFRGPASAKSCRFHRIFGGDRFLTLQIPFVQRSDLPSHLRPHAAKIHDEMVEWLATTEHSIAGRKWRAFWVDDKPPKAIKDKPSFNKVYLFATSGVGLQFDASMSERPLRRSMNIEDFIDLHVPFAKNANSSNLKMFARFKLGLSKTIATVTLEKRHFRKVDDIRGTKGKVMNDGCALMSPTLAHEIASQLCLSPTPSAFQGRISGAKGLWLVDHSYINHTGPSAHWIQVSPSQLKVFPHPIERDACEEYRQFEVSDWSKPPQPSTLNTQFLTVLADRGVPVEVLEGCLKEHVHQYYSTGLRNAMTDARWLRSWIQQYHRTPRNSEQVESSGAFPRDRTEKINMLLEAGFQPTDRSSPIRSIVRLCLRDYLDWWADKLKITLADESTFLYCVPDPYGVLEEGEVFCALSKGWIDPVTGAKSHFVTGREALVARSPANHPSDIRRVRMVFKYELQQLENVIVFSTKGDQPLASDLSGGDYDGDQVWVCWRPSLVEKFRNFGSGPPDHLTPELCGLVQRSKKLKDVLSSARTESGVNDFLSSCFDFNLKPSMVGICTNEHEKLVYHTSLRADGAVKLAALAAYLVDARKQGLELTEKAWFEIRAKCSGQLSLTTPAFKEATRVSRHKESNINDRLRFRVAQTEIEKAKKDFFEKFPHPLEYNSYFASIWITAENRAKLRPTALPILEKLKEQVDAVVQLWDHYAPGSQADENPGNFPQAVKVCFQELESIVPLPVNDDEKAGSIVLEDDIHRQHKDDRARRYSSWKLLRASCLYSWHWKRSLTWYMVGEELCFLQAERTGGMRALAGPLYAITKIDTKIVNNRMAGASVDGCETFDTSFSGAMDQWAHG